MVDSILINDVSTIHLVLLVNK